MTPLFKTLIFYLLIIGNNNYINNNNNNNNNIYIYIYKIEKVDDLFSKINI